MNSIKPGDLVRRKGLTDANAGVAWTNRRMEEVVKHGYTGLDSDSAIILPQGYHLVLSVDRATSLGAGRLCYVLLAGRGLAWTYEESLVRVGKEPKSPAREQ